MPSKYFQRLISVQFFIFHIYTNVPHKLVCIDTRCKLQLVSRNTRNTMPTILAYNSSPSSFDPIKNPAYYNLHTKEIIIFKSQFLNLTNLIYTYNYTYVHVTCFMYVSIVKIYCISMRHVKNILLNCGYERILTFSSAILTRRISKVSSAHFFATFSSSVTIILSKYMSGDIDHSSKPTAL